MDLGLPSKDLLIKTLKYILESNLRVQNVSDAAFEAVDTDQSGYLEKQEIEAVLQSVLKDFESQRAQSSSNQPPDYEMDIESVFKELDRDGDGRISKKEFVHLIREVLQRLLAHAEDNLNN